MMNTRDLLHRAGCEMVVDCGKKWEDLSSTDEDGIRFCVDCRKAVFYTKTPAELRLAAKRGLCVYILPDSAAHTSRNLNDYMMYKVSPERIKELEKNALQRMKGALLGVAKVI